MKVWILDKLTGMFGLPITAAISGLVGTLVAKVYAVLGGFPVVADLAREIVGQMPPEHAAAFSPTAIGAVVGAGVFAYIQQKLNATLRGETKAVQEAINGGLPLAEQIKVDGLAMKKTQAAAAKVALRAANPKVFR